MATSNFGYDEVLGVIALNTRDYETEELNYWNDEVAECEEEKKEYLTEDDWYWYYEDWKQEIEELNDKLLTTHIELESGYYESAMLRMKYNNSRCLSYSEYFTSQDIAMIINNRNDKNNLTKVCEELDCEYWCVSPSEIIKDYKVIDEWINARLKSGELLNLGIAYRFSNGETGYSINDELLEA